MQFNKSLLSEFLHEAENTRKLLAAVPMHQADWKPHDKSMSIGELAIHIADLPNWLLVTLDQEELDFAKEAPVQKRAGNTEELLAIHDAAIEKARVSLSAAEDNQRFMETWTMRNGEQVFMSIKKIGAIRGWVFNHIYHHRGQLTVYLRLLGTAVPGMYGPTADERSM
jgi:uncharacterized damage-inducible protein DinB